jgi:hypothetical protein
MLERLAKVIQHKTIDNEIHHSVEFHQQFKKKLTLQQKRAKMQKLTVENQEMLKRIQEVTPAYNHMEWEEDAKRKEHIKRCMALYPEYYERLDKEKLEKERLKQTKTGSVAFNNTGDNSGRETSPVTKLPTIKRT